MKTNIQIKNEAEHCLIEIEGTIGVPEAKRHFAMWTIFWPIWNMLSMKKTAKRYVHSATTTFR